MSSKGEKTFLADMSARALSPPPPLGLNGHMSKNVSCFFLCTNTSFFKTESEIFKFFPHNKSLHFLIGHFR